MTRKAKIIHYFQLLIAKQAYFLAVDISENEVAIDKMT